MPLPNDPSDTHYAYTIIASADSYALNPNEAFQIFMEQFATGDVHVEVRGVDESFDMSSIRGEYTADKIEAALTMLGECSTNLTAHEKIDLKNKINSILSF